MNISRKARRRAVPAVAAAAMIAAAAAAQAGGAAAQSSSASAQSSSAAPTRTVNAQQSVSANWAGYVVQSQSGQSFTSVSGSWTQPTVGSSTSDASSAFWVGLGGAGQQSQALEQVGTAADTSGGQVTYYAWYELVPAAQQRLSLAVHPGDRMTGKVTVNGTTVTVTLTDLTTGQSVTKTLQMSSPDTSTAEWIAEAPSTESPDGSMTTLPLADFGKVTFTSAAATAGGHTGSISDPAWSVEQIGLSDNGSGYFGPGQRFGLSDVSAQSGAGATAGSLSGDGGAFTVTYSADATGQSASPGAGAGYPGDGYGGGYGYGYGGGYGGGYGYGYGYGGGYPGGGYGYGGYLGY